MSSEDRRRAPRVFHSLRATLEWNAGDTESVKTIDLSASGVLLDVGRSAALNQSVKLKFEIAPQLESHTSGIVKRCSPAFGGRRYVLAVAFHEPEAALYATASSRESLMESAASRVEE